MYFGAIFEKDPNNYDFFVREGISTKQRECELVKHR
jgi:hypothetical protein